MRLPGVEARDSTIRGTEAEIPIRIYTPAEGRVDCAIVYYHWGGFVAGSIEESDGECRLLSAASGCSVVSVGYRLAPKHRFPAAVVDAFDALRWASENAGQLGASRRKLVVAGVSAGGNLAAVAAVMARDAGIPLAYQVLLTPVLGFDPHSSSAREFGRSGDLTMDQIVDFTTKYLGDLGRALDPRFSPIMAGDLRGVAPAIIVAAERDPLRDQALAYAEALRRAGVPVISITVNGVGHAMDGASWEFVDLAVAYYLRSRLSG